MGVSNQFRCVVCELRDGHVGMIGISRPDRSNAMNQDVWENLPKALQWLDDNGARAIVLYGEGKHFSAGIDLEALGEHFKKTSSLSCQGRARIEFASFVRRLQDSMSAFEKCRWPVIAAIHGACIGAGVDLATACDLRFAAEDAALCIAEVNLGITADMGTLNRLPGIVGVGIASDLALTGRTFSGAEAKSLHLVTSLFPTKKALLQGAEEAARALAAKSPLAVVGTKRMLLYQRDHSVQDGLEEVALWNAGTLPGSKDLLEVLRAKAERRVPLFSKL